MSGGKEHDIADHHERGGDNEEDIAFVEVPGQAGEENYKKCSNDVGRDGVQLLTKRTC